jgi:hypothetical protein
LLVGPAVAEVGFELLYWIPSLRRALRERDISPDSVVAMSRGGCESWYSDLAGRYVDALDLMTADQYRAGLARRRRGGDRKQWSEHPFDAELAKRAGEHLGVEPVAHLHPSWMFSRLRFVWSGDRPVEAMESLMTFERLDGSSSRGDTSSAHSLMDLPERYVAFKPYFNDCFPDNRANRQLLASIADELAERSHVVVLSTDAPMDDHSELVLPAAEHIHPVGSFLDPRTNLDLQTELIAGAERFVTPYGGASYIGLLAGTPTLAFYSDPSFNEVHLRTAREACEATGASEYRVVQARTLADLDLGSA